MLSAPSVEDLPPSSAPEIAFAGRSNVGKSSLLNRLCGRHALARVGATPGRTRTLNLFRVVRPGIGPAEICFVDLPGYGYVKAPRSLRASFAPMVLGYFTRRSSLRAVVAILDARQGATDLDRTLLEMLAELKIPCIAVMTKVDKLPKAKRIPAGAAIARQLGAGAKPPIGFSSVDGSGVEDLWRAIAEAAAGAPPAGGRP